LKRRRKSEPTRVGAALPRVLDELGLGSANDAMRLAEAWPRAVGAEVAQHAVPDVLRGDVLDVTVDSSVWCQQLQLRQLELVGALRTALGEGAPRELRFRVGRRAR